MASPSINIDQGKLVGTTSEDIDGNRFYSFRGIPYAKPPLGKLRFKAPQPPQPFQEIFYATENGPCGYSKDLFSKKIVGSEDCLNLNIYTPQKYPSHCQTKHMKLPLFHLLLLLLLTPSLFASVIKTIEKRQICSNNGCNSGCDGRSCNSCSNNVCCSSISCNQCVNQCSNDCSTISCKTNCVRGCASTCQSQSCGTQSCSQCVNRCSNQCQTNDCVNSCSRSCDCKEKEREDEIPVIVEPAQSAPVIVNNTNNNLVNLTTYVNIHNVMHNFNNITIPVYVNTTNINNINLSQAEESSSYTNGSSGHIEYIPYPQPQPYPIPQPQPYPIPQPIPAPIQDNCCTVLHPRQCITDEEGEKRCFIRRHRECSSACTSPVITIEQGGRSEGCQFIRRWPYAYCGNYYRGDCNECYTCGGNYNPSQCFRRPSCSNTCREAAPSCVQSGGGLQCY